MSPAIEAFFVARRELRKSVRSAKGIALLVISLAGGVATALLFAWLDKVKREKLGSAPPEVVEEIQRQLVLGLGNGDEVLGESLVKAPIALLWASKVTIFLGPLLVAVLGFDAVSGELQHRTVRYWTVRARRASFYVGKVAGLWTVVSCLTLLIHLITWVIIVLRGETAGAVAEWGPRFWLVSLPISLVWCSIAQLIGSQFRTPVLSLLLTFVSFFFLWIAFLLGASGKVPALLYVYPNVYDDWMLHPHLDRWLEGLGICLGSAGLYTAAGAFAFAQRDV